MENQKQTAQRILQRMNKGEINPLEAILETDRGIGGITGVNARKGLTIQNHKARISLNTEGLNKRQEEMLQEYTTLAYWLAQKNGNALPGEIHLEKGLSSKHYSQALRDYTQKLLTKYSPTLKGGQYGRN